MQEKMRLGDIATYVNGYPFKPEDRGTEGLPIIRIQDLTGNSYDLGFYNGEYPSRIEINNGDVLISWSGSLGVYIWDRGKALLNQHIFKVVFDKTEVDKQYYVFAVQHKLQEMESKTHGATMKHIVKSDFDNTVIPFPSCQEQHEISKKLKLIQCIIHARQQQLKSFDTLIKARFVEMFGDMLTNPMNWPEQRLEMIADIVSGITKGRKIQTTELFDVPYMAVSNVKDGYIDWTTVKTIAASQAEIDQYRLMPDDVLMTEGGDPDKLGRGAIIHNPPKDCIHQNHIFRVRLNQELILPVFMEQYLQQQRAKKYFLGCAKQTTGIASINMKQLRALPMLLPPKELQDQFAAFVTQIDKSKAVVQAALDKAQLLFDSLMQQYFG